MARLPASCIPDLMTFTRIAGNAKDIGSLRSQTLKRIRSVFRSDSTIVWMMGPNNRIGDPLELNVQRYLIPQYTNYYYRLNPLEPANLRSFRGSAISMEQVLPFYDFKKTEYYNDFIRPQKLRHQMVVYIRLNNRLTSVICTHRITDKEFSPEDLALGDIVSSHMSAAFDRIQMIQEVERRGSFFQMILDSTDVGLAALDWKRRVLFMNRKAVTICEGIKMNVISETAQHRSESVIPPPVLNDCQRLEEWVKTVQGVGLDLCPMKERVIAISSFEQCLFRSRLVDKGVTDSKDPLFLISMEIFPSHPGINAHAIKRDCNLTQRETEVISYIVKGYRNAEIADKLFISEGTVKNHLRNIFEKTNVKNRTSLIHKVLFL